MKYDLNGARVLVLGGSGFIGQHLCRALILADSKVTSVAAFEPAGDQVSQGLAQEIEWINGDFNDGQLISREVKRADIVFHLICTTLPASSNNDLELDLASNVLPTLRLLQAIRSSDVRKVVFVSSGGTVYGVPDQLPIPEGHATNPICGYGIHKIAIEKYLELFNHHYGMDYGVLRLSNPYGIGQISDRPQGVVGNFMHKALNDKPLEIWGDGSTIRDYIYIDDAISAFVAVAQHEGPSKVFNVGSGQGKSVLDVVKAIERSVGHVLDVVFRPGRPVDVHENVLDITLARSELQWAPMTDLETGVRAIHDQCVNQQTTHETLPISR